VSEPVLDIRSLEVSFGGAKLVDKVSFCLRSGQRLGLVGETGSGKSLTALSIMRLSHGATLGGEVVLDSRNLLKEPPRRMAQIRGGRIGMVYQDPMSSLNPVHTVGKQIIEALRLHTGLDKRAARLRAVELLGEVGLSRPELRVDQYPHEFSGGMRQRAMIAMAISAGPSVLICDEPTTALDVTTQARIIDLLDRIVEQHGTAVLLITHDLGVAAGFCSDILVMHRGKIIESAPAVRLYRHPQQEYTKGLLSAVVDLTTDVDSPIPTGRIRRDGARSMADLGRDRPTGRTTSHRAADGPLVSVRGVSKSFRLGRREHTQAVDGVSFEIFAGETFGLAGESGSGKSTVARAVLGLMTIDGGSVEFEGRDIHGLRTGELRALRRRMQIVFQDPYAALNRAQTVRQIISAPLEAHGIGTKQARARKVDEVLELVGLDASFKKRVPRSLSGGQCQRVAIARALALDPDFVVLDEPVTALDASTRARILNLLRDLQDHLGLTYLFISHDLAVIRYMAQRVAVMQQGQIVEQGERETLFSSPRHDYTKSLMAAIPVADPIAERKRRGLTDASPEPAAAARLPGERCQATSGKLEHQPSAEPHGA
jgi:peptide/nickel transport system ATP-binding protein